MEDELHEVVLLTDLSTDALSLVLLRLAGRARDIARTAVVNKAFRDATCLAEQAHRRVCIEGHDKIVNLSLIHI